MKTLVAVGFIALILTLSVIPINGIIVVEKHSPSNKGITSTSGSFKGNILYVGGGGPNNFTKIQYAIDNATFGDTVFVYSGTYYENIEVDRSITLIGENSATTIIDGSDKGMAQPSGALGIGRVVIDLPTPSIKAFETLVPRTDPEDTLPVLKDRLNIVVA